LYKFCAIDSIQPSLGLGCRRSHALCLRPPRRRLRLARDKDWRRCRCPKWISGTQGGELVRKSAKTRSWEKAEAYRRGLEGTSGPTAVQTDESFRISDRAPTGRHRDQKKARVTIETAVDAYLRDARSRELESSTLSKLEGIFRKQFLTWCTSEGYKFLDEVDLDALLLFRDTWIDGPLAKRKKQERLIGFFWACVRRGYITENPTFGLGKIKVDQTPTDYFPPHEFEKIVDATYAYRENRGETGNANSTRLRTMTLPLLFSITYKTKVAS
jgi:integrase/recombinase XerD